MAAIGNHKFEFYTKLDAMIDEKQNEKFVISDSIYNEIIQSIKSDRKEDAQLKRLANDQFRLKSKENIEYLETNDGEMIPRYSQLFDIINAVHQTAGHSDGEKTYKEVYQKCGFIRREVMQIFLENCPFCQRELAKKTIPNLPEMYSLTCMTLVQFSILNVAPKADSSEKYILHIRDLYSRFSWGRCLSSYSVKDIAAYLICIFWNACKAPSILQSDDGEEFTYKVLNKMVCYSSGSYKDVKVGRSRDPGSPSFLEESNADLMNRLEGWMSRHKDESWSEGLEQIIYRMNMTNNPIHGKTPFQVMFPNRGTIPLRDSPTKAITEPQDPCNVSDSASEAGSVSDSTVKQEKTDGIIS